MTGAVCIHRQALLVLSTFLKKRAPVSFTHTHSLFALWQMYAVMFPDFREYFMSHGSPALKVIICVCVCVYICILYMLCMYVCVYVCMYACIDFYVFHAHLCMYVYTYVCNAPS